MNSDELKLFIFEKKYFWNQKQKKTAIDRSLEQ